MKLKFSYFLFAFFVCSLSGCTLRSTEKNEDFLIKKYNLIGVFDYNPNDMTRKGHISNSSPKVRYDSYFNKNRSFFNFTYDKNTFDYTYEFSLDCKNNNSVYLVNEKYSLKMKSVDFGRINFETNNEIFNKNDNTVNPNYWLRVHTFLDLNNENKEIILEFRTVYN